MVELSPDAIAQENARVIKDVRFRNADSRSIALCEEMAARGERLSLVIDNPYAERENSGVELPPIISDHITYNAWTGLCTAVMDGYVPNQKWLMSEIWGFDIGVPETVRRMLRDNPTNSRGVYWVLMIRVKESEQDDFIRLLSIGALLSTDFVSSYPPHHDGHGSTPLEGELKRYWARINGIIEPASVHLNREIVGEYCAGHSLDIAIDRFNNHLGL